MNFTTHVLFGLLVAAIFFGRPEAILLVGIGSAIPDMDREYGFFRESSFRDLQIHRALFHNFISIGILYLINPFLGIGAFLHTLLDALTTAKDRGIEWLFPFSRLVTKAVYDEEGRELPEAKEDGIKFYQNDLIEAARKSDRDLREYTPKPWRRTYGPALSAGLLDLSIGFGSLALLVFVYLISKFGGHQFIQTSFVVLPNSFTIPFVIGTAGILLEIMGGEIDRKREATRTERHPWFYHVLFFSSLILIAIGLLLGAAYNSGTVSSILGLLPYYLGGAAIVVVVAAVVLLTRPTNKFSRKEEPEERSVL